VVTRGHCPSDAKDFILRKLVTLCPPKPARILVVEDMADLRDAMALLLRMEGHEVLVASNGREALDLLARAAPPQVALVDLLMPEMDGSSFVAHLRKDPQLARIRVVVVTAVSSPHVTRLVAADAHIFKPFEASHLLQTVRTLIA
jgi:CheY-like chemotaxis protein